MNRSSLFVASFLFFFCSYTSAVFSAALDKYGTEQRYNVAPEQQLSSREIAIRRAVRNIDNASNQERGKLIQEYKQRIKEALKGDRYDEAAFYNEILRRAGY